MLIEEGDLQTQKCLLSTKDLRKNCPLILNTSLSQTHVTSCLLYFV